METIRQTELAFENVDVDVDFELLETSDNIQVLKIVNCIVHNVNLMTEKFTNLKQLTLETNNEVIFHPNTFKKLNLIYVKLNQNVIIKSDKIYDITCCRNFILKKYEKTKLSSMYIFKQFMIFIHGTSMLVLIDSPERRINIGYIPPNIKTMCIYYRSFCYDKSFLDQLPVELEELSFINLIYTNLTNLPPCLKK
jgi:hypothetical protein